MTTRLSNLPAIFSLQFLVTTSGTPEQLTVKRRAATIAFNENSAAADTITDSGNGLVTAGFQPGDQLTVTGSASNDGTYEVDTVAAGTITLRARNDLATEAAGATVVLTASKHLPDGVSVNIKAMSANTGDITMGYSSATALNTGTGSFRLDANESLSMQVSDINSIWLDVTVSGEGVEVSFEKNIQA